MDWMGEAKEGKMLDVGEKLGEKRGTALLREEGRLKAMPCEEA